jgi:hypothetical protein
MTRTIEWAASAALLAFIAGYWLGLDDNKYTQLAEVRLGMVENRDDMVWWLYRHNTEMCAEEMIRSNCKPIDRHWAQRMNAKFGDPRLERLTWGDVEAGP